MGYAVVPGNGPNPEIMLAIDFRGPFCPLFEQAKSGKETAPGTIFIRDIIFDFEAHEYKALLNAILLKVDSKLQL